MSICLFRLVVLTAVCLFAYHAGAGDLSFSDPANVAKPPAWAVGQADRSASLDVLPGFQKPPAGFGDVPFYWWLGDPLTRERLSWQLDQLQKSGGISGLQVNYAHSDRGGSSWGLTYPSDPALFSEEWWKLYGWFMQEVKKRGMGGVSLSDYTLGIGQGWYFDEIMKEYPDSRGANVGIGDGPKVEGGKEVKWRVPENFIGVTAFKMDGDKVVPGSAVDLRPFVKDGELSWPAPDGGWKIKCTMQHIKPQSLNPLHPLSGKRYIEKFFQRFEDRNPGEGGKGLNFFFSDELNLQVGGNLWTEHFGEDFKKMKGYDLIPELPGIFMDIGPRTEKIRLDYRDVMVALSEDAFFKPIFDWHQKRGMIYGCDHGGRGGDVVEFGDYFRTQRWNQGPGSDQPGLSADVTKAKVASSMAHLYLRPRVWLEGYHSSGWGTTSEQVTSATFNNFVAGYNLLSFHGLYYSTHGGWWEWAPPCNHFRMPYWAHMDRFMDCLKRLSYLLSQGYHRCDVAIMYPVAPMQAGLSGHESVGAAFGTGGHLYGRSIDFDFMDFESLARAKVENKQLRVSGEEYRVLVLPSMRAVHCSTIQKAAEFFNAGGIVIAIGDLPEASDRAGREDAELDALVKSVFGFTAKEAKGSRELKKNTNAAGGLAVLAQNAGQIEDVINKVFTRDFAGKEKNPRIQHRRIGPRDVYAIYGAGRGTECFFRATGKAELWDPWTGTTSSLSVLSQDTEGTRLKLPLTQSEIQLIVFSPGKAAVAGDAAEKAPQVVKIEGEWDFELKPTMDNRWGDFRWPPFKGLIGAEARRLRYCEETAANPGWQDPKYDDSKWRTVTYSFGQKFWKLGPMPEKADMTALEAQLAGLKQVDPVVAIEFDGKKYTWQPYDFSWRFGVEGDTGRQGYHGLKELVADTFIGIGAFRSGGMMPNSGRAKEEGGTRYYLWTSVVSPAGGGTRVLAGGNLPASVWLNNLRQEKVPAQVNLVKGSNPLLLRYDNIGRGFFVFDQEKEGSKFAAVANANDAPDASVKPLAMSWYGRPGVLAFDARAGEKRPAGWYRFMSPPGLKGMTITARGKVRAWVDGKECTKKEVRIQKSEFRDRTEHAVVYSVKVDKPADGSVSVVIRVEQERGCYGGASLPEPVALDCGVGKVSPGNWAAIESLASYSGGAWYRKTISLTEEQLKGRVVLNLGSLSSSVEVHVNGKLAGVKVSSPWTFDITQFARKGENRVEVLVYNSLANHYSTIPTHYRGNPMSGLMGPVSLEVY